MSGSRTKVYHDPIHWLGGLPYEVASAVEVLATCKHLGFTCQSFDDTAERARVFMTEVESA